MGEELVCVLPVRGSNPGSYGHPFPQGKAHENMRAAPEDSSEMHFVLRRYGVCDLGIVIINKLLRAPSRSPAGVGKAWERRTLGEVWSLLVTLKFRECVRGFANVKVRDLPCGLEFNTNSIAVDLNSARMESSSEAGDSSTRIKRNHRRSPGTHRPVGTDGPKILVAGEFFVPGKGGIQVLVALVVGPLVSRILLT